MRVHAVTNTYIFPAVVLPLGVTACPSIVSEVSPPLLRVSSTGSRSPDGVVSLFLYIFFTASLHLCQSLITLPIHLSPLPPSPFTDRLSPSILQYPTLSLAISSTHIQSLSRSHSVSAAKHNGCTALDACVSCLMHRIRAVTNSGLWTRRLQVRLARSSNAILRWKRDQLRKSRRLVASRRGP